MLTPGLLNNAFRNWDEMDRCRRGRTYWALLHIVVCLTDIGAALQSLTGENSVDLYIDWCNHHLNDPLLNGAERYGMRCKVLNRGRATTDDQTGRYDGFSFGQPAADG